MISKIINFFKFLFSKKEIERKWLFKEYCLMEFLEDLEYVIIIQKYLFVGTEREVRIRKMVIFKDNDIIKKYFLEEKTGTGLSRKEKSKEISKREYDELYECDNFKPIKKTKYLLDKGKYLIEIDRYWDRSIPDVVEIEFNSKLQAVNFKPPLFCGKEITCDEGYKNKNLYLKINKGSVPNERECKK